MKQLISRISIALAGSVTAFVCIAHMALPVQIFAQSGVACRAGDPGCTYIPLTTIPGVSVGCNPGLVNNKIDTSGCTPVNPVNVIKNFYGIAIGIAAVLAVIMIIFAGLKYITVESISGHSDAKDTWTGAIYGLLLLLGSYVILRTINLELVEVNLDLGEPKAGTKKVSVNVLASFVESIDKQAQSAIDAQKIAVNQVASARADLVKTKTEITKLEDELINMDLADTANDEKAQELQIKIEALKQEERIQAENVRALDTQAKLDTLTASGLKGLSNINIALSAEDIDSAVAQKNSNKETATRYINDLKNIGAGPEVVQKAEAIAQVNELLSAQSIAIATSLRSIKTVTLQMPTYMDARKMFSSYIETTGSRIDQTQTSEVARYREQSRLLLAEFDKKAATIICSGRSASITINGNSGSCN